MNYLLDEDYHSLVPPGIMNYLRDEDYHSLTPSGNHSSISWEILNLFSLKKWNFRILLGKYQTVFQEEKLTLVNHVGESTLLGEENCSLTLWGIPKCETDYLI